MSNIDLLFSSVGGKFCTPVKELAQKISSARAVVFDWDGVFNNGIKDGASGSRFSEPDAMGINLLRLTFWLAERKMAPVAILTGEENRSAIYLARREHYSAVYFKSTNKITSFQHFISKHGLSPKDVIFVFDDVLDLSVAEVCGVRIQVNRPSGVMLNQYIGINGLTDYVTSSDGGHFAVREACELIMGLNGSFESAVRERILFGPTYQEYLAARQAIYSRVFSVADGVVRDVSGKV